MQYSLTQVVLQSVRSCKATLRSFKNRWFEAAKNDAHEEILIKAWKEALADKSHLGPAKWQTRATLRCLCTTRVLELKSVEQTRKK